MKENTKSGRLNDSKRKNRIKSQDFLNADLIPPTQNKSSENIAKFLHRHTFFLHNPPQCVNSSLRH